MRATGALPYGRQPDVPISSLPFSVWKATIYSARVIDLTQPDLVEIGTGLPSSGCLNNALEGPEYVRGFWRSRGIPLTNVHTFVLFTFASFSSTRSANVQTRWNVNGENCKQNLRPLWNRVELIDRNESPGPQRLGRCAVFVVRQWSTDTSKRLVVVAKGSRKRNSKPLFNRCVLITAVHRSQNVILLVSKNRTKRLPSSPTTVPVRETRIRYLGTDGFVFRENTLEKRMKTSF